MRDRAVERGGEGVRGCGRVLHVLNGFGLGGNESMCLELMRRIPADERLLLNVGADGPMRSRFEALPGIRIVAVPYRRTGRVRFVREVAAVLRDLAPRALLVHPLGLHLLVAIAARLSGVPVVVVRSGNPPPADRRARRKWRAIVWASALLRTPIVSCSRWVDTELRRLSRLVPRGSRPIPNGVAVEAIAERAARARRERADARPAVGMVARLNAIKDHATLLRAVALVARELPDVELRLAGDGEERPRLERLASELGIGRSVAFLGHREDVPELLGALDVYAFSTTRDEGFGVALAEALAAGLPVVASDVAPCREVLQDGAAGLLVAPGGAEAMAAAILRLLRDAREREAWAARARAGAEALSIGRCVASWVDVLRGTA